jgi:predicted Zn-dependent protease
MSTKVCAFFAVCVAASGQERQPGRGVNFFSTEREAALGAQIAQEIRRQSTVIESPAVLYYIHRVSEKLSAQVPQLPPLKLELTSDFDTGAAPLHEPIALPGGYTFIRARLFLSAQDEAEFATMLAHAIAHVAERHGTRMATRVQVSNLASIPLVFTGPMHASSLLPQGLLKFARADELEADKLAARISAAAGYDPQALVRYIDRSQTDQPNPERSPLPPREERIASLTEFIRTLPDNTFSAGPEFQSIRDEVRRLLNQPPPEKKEPPSLRRNTPEQP